MTVLDYIGLGILAVFQGPETFSLLGLPVPVTLVMILARFLPGIVVGATPGMAGPVAMAISLPILISVFGYHASAMLPVVGFLIGIMKGEMVGGAVPAILFNTPGTPDAYMTMLDGYPMALRSKAKRHCGWRIFHRRPAIPFRTSFCSYVRLFSPLWWKPIWTFRRRQRF